MGQQAVKVSISYVAFSCTLKIHTLPRLALPEPMAHPLQPFSGGDL